MKKFIPIAFIVAAGILAFFLIFGKAFSPEEEISRARTVTPQVFGADSEENSSDSEYDDFATTSFIELANDETLMSVVTMDVDGDGFDDQVNIVKTSKSPFLTLIIGLYNPQTTSYIRSSWINTNISQIKTFACTSLDVIGNHKNSLVYQGITDSGFSVLRIYNGGRDKKGNFTLSLIGEFESDGTIFIQQQERNEAYELSRTKGESFPVWVYSSDTTEESQSLDQIQTMYDWSEEEKCYVEVKKIRVAGSRLAAKELARIQDGSTETFEKFLDGLWYKTSVSGENMRYLFFDHLNREIIFQYQDSEEVYSWLESKLRRNGIYFSSVNKSIGNLQRRFDISLVGIDEIRIRIQDDVRMIIGESTLWDGNYKKLTTKKAASPQPKEKDILDLLVSQKNWLTRDGKYFQFEKNSYSYKDDNIQDSGNFLPVQISGKLLLQFKSGQDSKVMNGYYEINFGTKTVKKTDRRGRVTEETVTDRETVVLQPVNATPENYFPKEMPALILKKAPDNAENLKS